MGMRPKGNASELETRRLLAGQLLLQDERGRRGLGNRWCLKGFGEPCDPLINHARVNRGRDEKKLNPSAAERDCAAPFASQQQRMGHEPQSVVMVLSGDTMLIALHEAFADDTPWWGCVSNGTQTP